MMNILMITEKDGANQSLSRIEQELIKRGHKIKIYAPFYDKNILEYFDKEVEIIPYEMLDDTAIEWCDIIIASVLVANFLQQKKLLFVKKPIFTHNCLISGQICWGGDVSFVSSSLTTMSQYDDLIECTQIEIGDPKYDSILSIKKDKKILLFLDSGHYPFSDKGKLQLAQTLIKIANTFPEYELWIKPRFLPEDKIITHENKVHIYDVIHSVTNGYIPDNMVLLKTHNNVQELIDICDTVICMYTTAFVGAYTSNKGLVVLDGLDNEDVYELRSKNFRHTHDEMEPWGALVNYKDVCSVLPYGIKCPDDYGKKLLVEKECVAGKLCDLIESIFEKFSMQGVYPIGKGLYSYKDCLEQKLELKEMDWEQVIINRCKSYLAYRMLILIDFNVSNQLDISRIRSVLYEMPSDYFGFIEEYEQLAEKATYIRDLCICDNYERMLSDKIDSGILLNAIYNTKNKEMFCKFPVKDIGAYFLYNAFFSWDNHDINRTDIYIRRYFEITINRKYNVEISDMPNNKKKAKEILNSIIKGVKCQE